MIKVYDIRINNSPQYVLQGENFLGFDWSHYCRSLIATYSRNSDIVKFWDINILESERAKAELIEIQQASTRKAPSNVQNQGAIHTQDNSG